MSLISSISPNGSISGPVPNVQTQAVAQTVSATDVTPAARSILPSAVAATRIVPSYATETPRSSDTPSSALAAQFIAQTPDATDEQLSVFATPTAAQEARAQASLNIERGIISPPLAPVIAKVPIPQPQQQLQPAQTQPANDNAALATSTTTNKLTQDAATTATVGKTTLPEARTQTTATSATAKKSTLVQARGTSAYQLAGSRHAVAVPSSFEAILS